LKLVLISFLFCFSLNASEIGLVLKAKGKVFKAFNKDKRVVDGDVLKRKDVIITEKASFVRMKMLDDTVITLGPNSSLLLQRFQFTNKQKRKFSIKLLRGKLRGSVANKAKKGDLKFETDSVSLGIRGTEFLINAGDVTKVAVLSGKVTLYNKLDDTVSEMVAGAQFISIINKDKSKFNSKLVNLGEGKIKLLAAKSIKLRPDTGEVALSSSADGEESKKLKEVPLEEDLFLGDMTDLSPSKELSSDKRDYLFK